MLSYVVPAPSATATATSTAKNNAASSQGNLSLNLNPQYDGLLDKSDAFGKETNLMESQDVLLANAPNTCDERTQLLKCSTPPRPRRQHNSSRSNNNNITVTNNDNCVNSSNCVEGDVEDELITEDITTTTVNAESDSSDKQLPRQITKKTKLTKLGSKTLGLKRVSFGSSKGSMVETLVFETPTPLSEQIEPLFCFDAESNYKLPLNFNVSSKTNLDDSGIEVQEESERSIVRVSIYQSSQPQQICPPDILTRLEEQLDNSFSNYSYNLEDIMTAESTIPGYDRQQSTDSGWDNPFRPGGDLSREADEIVNMIRGGKPITPTGDHQIGNGNGQKDENCNGMTAVESVTKSNVTQTQSAQNGTNSHKVQSAAKPSENNGVTSSAQVSKQVVPGPISASHVVIDEKKNKKKGCCVIQ